MPMTLADHFINSITSKHSSVRFYASPTESLTGYAIPGFPWAGSRQESLGCLFEFTPTLRAGRILPVKQSCTIWLHCGILSLFLPHINKFTNAVLFHSRPGQLLDKIVRKPVFLVLFFCWELIYMWAALTIVVKLGKSSEQVVSEHAHKNISK